MEAINKYLVRGPIYWVFLIFLGIAMEGIALFYQYALNYGPCVLCIHVRMWTMAFILVAIVMLWGYRYRATRIIGHISAAGIMLALAERSWQLLSTERGWSMGSCEMRSGLPDWVPLEQWFPYLFKIHEPCGYTPDMPFGLTMAESLIALSAGLSALALLLVILALLNRRH